MRGVRLQHSSVILGEVGGHMISGCSVVTGFVGMIGETTSPEFFVPWKGEVVVWKGMQL